MDEIVLDRDLKFLMGGLDMMQRGQLFTALLDNDYEGSDDAVNGVFCYIASLQEKKRDKKERMRELSALGVSARLKKLSEAKSAVNRRLSERKEAKESILNNKNKFNLFSLRDEKDKVKTFVAPNVAEVQKFVDDNKLKVDAETFVNFYEAHGWMMGKVPIHNWQATVRLWQKRAEDNEADKQKNSALIQKNDEDYWHELKQRVMSDGQQALDGFPNIRKNLPAEHIESLDVDLSEKPFVRFMRRVEKFDFNTENEHE